MSRVDRLTVESIIGTMTCSRISTDAFKSTLDLYGKMNIPLCNLNLISTTFDENGNHLAKGATSYFFD